MPWTTGQKIFIVEAYFRQKSIHAAQLTMSGFRTRHIICCQVTWTPRATSSGVAHPLSTVCKCHYTLWSALPGLPSPNSIIGPFWFEDDNERSVTINTERYVQVLGKFWTALGRRRGVVRVLQWFQQDGATPHSSNEWLAWLQQRFLWATDQPQVWPAVVAAFTGFEHPIFLSVGDTLRTECMATTPRLSLTWRQQSQQQ